MHQLQICLWVVGLNAHTKFIDDLNLLLWLQVLKDMAVRYEDAYDDSKPHCSPRQ
jgi:hypothetical protein